MFTKISVNVKLKNRKKTCSSFKNSVFATLCIVSYFSFCFANQYSLKKKKGKEKGNIKILLTA